MAKKFFKPRTHETGTVITTKTPYGSTSDMIVDLNLYTMDGISIGENEVICKDDRGFYITLKSRIDTGLADPNRYASVKARVSLKEKESSS